MSSTYRFLCLSHTPAIVVDSWETQSSDEAVGLAERRTSAKQLSDHHACRLVVGRFSYPLVEVYNPATRRWADVDVLRLLLAAHDAGLSAGVLAPFARQGWDPETLDRLRRYIDLSSAVSPGEQPNEEEVN